MNNKENDELGRQIARLLDQHAAQIGDGTSAKLLEARKLALAHYQGKPAPGWAPNWATATVGRIAEPFSNNLRAGLILLAVLASLAGGVAWQTFNGNSGGDLAEIDEALLTDELPINAYLDKGFDSWLKRP
jgi:Protein of unknown function (DUF3619)